MRWCHNPATMESFVTTCLWTMLVVSLVHGLSGYAFQNTADQENRNQVRKLTSTEDSVACAIFNSMQLANTYSNWHCNMTACTLPVLGCNNENYVVSFNAQYVEGDKSVHLVLAFHCCCRVSSSRDIAIEWVDNVYTLSINCKWYANESLLY